MNECINNNSKLNLRLTISTNWNIYLPSRIQLHKKINIIYIAFSLLSSIISLSNFYTPSFQNNKYIIQCIFVSEM